VYYRQLIVIIIFLSVLRGVDSVYANGQPHTIPCRTSSSEELARSEKFYQTASLQGNLFKTPALNQNSCHTADLHKLQKDSLQKVEAFQQDKKFQEIVAELQDISPSFSNDFKGLSGGNNGELYIFVSFSVGAKALLNLAHDAKRFGATLVLRGFKEGSYLKTVQALHKIILKTGQGVLIDPELYKLFNITAVPTFILAKPFTLNPTERIQTPIHDKLQGHVSIRYALEQFEKEGDLKEEARIILISGETP
jgi:type-F conjugative transfer system pilin assembly protein TrbC